MQVDKSERLQISFTGIGPKVSDTTRKKISKGDPIKSETEIEGLYFINKVIREININNNLDVPESLLSTECQRSIDCCKEFCKVYENKIIVTLYPMRANSQ